MKIEETKRAVLHDKDYNWCRNSTQRIFSPKSLYKFNKRRHFLFALLTTFLLISAVLNYSLHILVKTLVAVNRPRNGKFPYAIRCYLETKDNILVSADDLIPPENSIFFHETSCSGGLNSRQACSVEAAAILHPNRTVYVFFNSPVTENTLKSTSLLRLLRLPNIRLARVDIRTYGRGTPLAEVLVESQYIERSWILEHMADLLRFTTLYKYGGLHLDLDMLVVKNLDVLGANWGCREDHTSVSAGVMSFSKHDIGGKMARFIANDLKWNFKPWDWGYNGPGSITRAVLSICSAVDIVPTEAGDFSCQGFTVYNPAYFYLIHYKHSETYFKSDSSFREAPEVYGYHVWNWLTKDMVVMPDSPYDTLAKKYCPTVRSMYGDAFGNNFVTVKKWTL